MPLEQLIAEYQARGLGRDQALEAIAAEARDLARERPRRLQGPPSPAAVVARVAEALPQPPVFPPAGDYYAKVSPDGEIEAKGWRPPGIRPVGFHRGYWYVREGDTLVLVRSGQPVNQWLVLTGDALSKSLTEVRDFVKRWPIQAEKSVIPGRRY